MTKPIYSERIEADYHALKAWLPKKVSSWLDIGCGSYPLIDWWIAKHYGSADLDIHLLDGEEDRPQLGKNGTGWQLKTTTWKSRLPGVEWLQREFPQCRVHGHAADETLTIPCDLIISRRSWGHHYPISTYIKLAVRSLRPGWRIITDLRIGRDGMKTFLSFGFKPVTDNLEVHNLDVRSYKCHRIALERS